MTHRSIPVLDFGGQTAQLLVRRVRELGVYSELVPFDAPEEAVRKLNPLGLILSGGWASVYEPGAPTLPEWVQRANLPGPPIWWYCPHGQLRRTRILTVRAVGRPRLRGYRAKCLRFQVSPVFGHGSIDGAAQQPVTGGSYAQ